jgi:hypothetical protein
MIIVDLTAMSAAHVGWSRGRSAMVAGRGEAKDADVVTMTATTFDDLPDIVVTDSAFHGMKKETDVNPQHAKLLWGSGGLIEYRNADGVELQAALYKPENFDPSRMYPMTICFYERLRRTFIISCGRSRERRSTWRIT